MPNKCPFKEEILVEAEKERERIALEKAERKKTGKQLRPEDIAVGLKRKMETTSNDLEGLAIKAAKKVAL